MPFNIILNFSADDICFTYNQCKQKLFARQDHREYLNSWRYDTIIWIAVVLKIRLIFWISKCWIDFWNYFDLFLKERCLRKWQMIGCVKIVRLLTIALYICERFYTLAISHASMINITIDLTGIFTTQSSNCTEGFKK